MAASAAEGARKKAFMETPTGGPPSPNKDKDEAAIFREFYKTENQWNK
jgi:hypothetical protein